MIIRFLIQAVFCLLSWVALSCSSDIELSLNGPKYNVKLLNHPTLELSGSTVQVYSKYGQPFSCKLPQISLNDDMSNETITNLRVQNLLTALPSRCISMLTGWWTYEVCFRRNVSQYHANEIDPTKRSSEKVLGHFSNETNWDANDENLQKRTYHSQWYRDGEICDITSKPRLAEVRFACFGGESIGIHSVEEVETCVYLIYVNVPSLCYLSRFKGAEGSTEEDILCHPIVTPKEMSLFQMNDNYIRPSEGSVELIDEKQRKSDNRVTTLWYTHKRLVARRQNRERRRFKQLARRLFALLFHKVKSQQARSFDRLAMASYFRQVQLSNTPTPLAYWLLSHQLRHLSADLYDLAFVIENLQDMKPLQLVNLRALVNPIKILLKDIDYVIRLASGQNSVSPVPMTNLLEAITILQTISWRFILSDDGSELKIFAGDINKIHNAFAPPKLFSTTVVPPKRHSKLVTSPAMVDTLIALKNVLTLHLAELQLSIRNAEKENLVNAITEHLENSVTSILSDLRDQVVVVRQPPRSSPNPRVAANPYQNRKSAGSKETIHGKETPPEAKHTEDDEEEIVSNQVVFSRVIEKVLKNVLPGVSVFQAAPARPGSMEVLYLYSSEQKGKEDRRSSRQESAYQFTMNRKRKRPRNAAGANAGTAGGQL